MSGIKRYIRKNRTLSEIIIFLVALLLIVLCKISKPTLLSEIGFGVGTSMLASAVIVFMTDAFIGADESNARAFGLEAYYNTRGEMNGSCAEYLQKAKYFHAIAFGMRSLRDAQKKSIERILREGGTIKILTMKPYCENLRARERDEGVVDGEISQSIQQLIEWANELNGKSYRGKVEIRYHEAQPQNFVFLMDNRLFTGPYEYGKKSQQTISFEYNNYGEAYNHYKELFDDLWEKNGFCTDALKEKYDKS